MLGVELPPYISGGLGIACDGLLRGICSAGGVSVQFVVPNSLPALVAYPPAVQIFKLDDDAASLRVSLLSHATSATYIEKAKNYGAAVIRSLEQMNDFDIVHAHDWLTFIAALEIKRLTGKALVVHIHSTEVNRATHQLANPLVRALEGNGMDAADCIVTVSRYSKERVAHDYAQPLKKIEVIYNASVRSNRAPASVPPDRGSCITFIGRITEQKGPKAFVDAARGICNIRPDSRFVMAGDGDLLPMIRSQVNDLKMTKNFLFPGFLNREKVDLLLAQTRLLVMPSLSEPFGLVGLEAIQAGVPVILSKNCGLTEIIPSAIQVDPERVQETIDAAISILGDPAAAQARARVAFQEAEKLSWTTSARQLFRVYRAARLRTR